MVWLLLSFFYDKTPLLGTYIFSRILSLSLIIEIGFLGLVCGRVQSLKKYDKFWSLHWMATILITVKTLLGTHVQYTLYQGDVELKDLTWIEVFQETQSNELFFASTFFWLMYFLNKTPS